MVSGPDIMPETFFQKLKPALFDSPFFPPENLPMPEFFPYIYKTHE
jgi:hypothetical protein